MLSEKSNSLDKRQKHSTVSSTAVKSKTVSQSGAKKAQLTAQQSDKKQSISKPQLINGVSKLNKLSNPSREDDKSGSDSSGKHARKEAKSKSAKNEIIQSNMSRSSKVAPVSDNSRDSAPILPKSIPPPVTIATISPQRRIPKVDSFWSVTIREHDVSYRWSEEMGEEKSLAYKEARRLRYAKALQAQKEELGINENKRKYFYAPINH